MSLGQPLLNNAWQDAAAVAMSGKSSLHACCQLLSRIFASTAQTPTGCAFSDEYRVNLMIGYCKRSLHRPCKPICHSGDLENAFSMSAYRYFFLRGLRCDFWSNCERKHGIELFEFTAQRLIE